MNFDADRFMTEKNISYLYLKILSLVLILIATGIFIYFFITGNFQIHYLISIGCLWLMICGIYIALFAYLMKSEKSIELTFEKISQQVKRFGWLSLGAFYLSGICLFAGLIFFAQRGAIWRNSIILFTGSILFMIISVYGLIQRKISKQHYELKKQQQEIIELLSEKKSREIKDISGGVLLA